MTLHWSDWPQPVLDTIRRGCVIPAHLLALDEKRQLDRRRQRALSRYYIDAGAGALAVGVHSTQFAIREAGLYRTVLELAADTAADWSPRTMPMIAGICGNTGQALAEAETARALHYHAGLVSLAALRGAGEDELIAHCQQIAAVLPIMGFYLQPAVGGIHLSKRFWHRFAAIDNAVAIKIAPFNRYRTLDVMAGVVAARAEDRITLYTGNDDHIVLDLLTPYLVQRAQETLTVRIRGGLLGHWSVWTRGAVQTFERTQHALEAGSLDIDLLSLDAKITDCNSAFFDAANDFRGCIAGCHEVLRRQGLFEGIWCLDPAEQLSPGQSAEIDRVYQAYPELNDDSFVSANIERWLQ